MQDEPSKPKTKADLEAENAKLREQVDSLMRQLAPPPPKPEPEKPQRETVYLLALTSPEMTPGRVEVTKNLALTCRGQIREKMPELDWEIAYRIEDLPAYAYAVLLSDFLRAGFDAGPKQVHWYSSATDDELAENSGRTLVYRPTDKQAERFSADGKRLIAKIDELMEASNAIADSLGPDDDYWQPNAYGLIVKVLLAELNVLIATYKSGEDWYGIAKEAIAKADERRAEIDDRLPEREKLWKSGRVSVKTDD